MTGLHTGHAWIRGNGEIPLRPKTTSPSPRCCATPAIARRSSASGGSGMPGTTGQPDRKGFDYAFGFLDHRHAHRQYTDHLWRNGERVAGRSRPRLRQRPVHARGRGVHRARRPAAVLRLPQLHRAARRAARAGRLDGAAPGPLLPRRRSSTPRPMPGRPAPARRRVARLPVAAGAARGVRRDDHAHGSRHRPA